MSKANKNKESDVILLVLTILGVIFLIAAISRIAKDLRPNRGHGIISKEGQELLRNETALDKALNSLDEIGQVKVH